MSLQSGLMDRSYFQGYEAGERAATQRMIPLLASIIEAAGGEVTVPMTLLQEDYTIERKEGSSLDPFGDTVTYKETKA